jgi:membrane associated rhomboid family serine protease
MTALLVVTLLVLQAPEVDRSQELVPTALAARVGGLSTHAVLGDGEYWRCLAGSLVHDSGLSLLVFAVVLLVFGRVLERALGVARFVILFALSGLAGALAWLALARAFGSGVELAATTDAGPDAVPGSLAAMWGVIGAVWGVALRGVPARRKLAIRQIATLGVLAGTAALLWPRLWLGGALVGAATGLGLSVAFMRGGVPRREGAATRRVAFALLLALAASVGRGLSALAPDAESAARAARPALRKIAERVRDAPDSLDRAAKADLARELDDAGAAAAAAGEPPAPLAARRQLRELLLDAADAPQLRAAAQQLLDALKDG